MVPDLSELVSVIESSGYLIWMGYTQLDRVELYTWSDSTTPWQGEQGRHGCVLLLVGVSKVVIHEQLSRGVRV